MTKKLLLTICVLTATFYFANAQSWQWGKRGGSSDVGGSAGPDETVVDMATDPNGNIYTLSYVLNTGLNVDGYAIAGWGGQNILISSFRCDGTYRWSKIIGGGSEGAPVALKTDTLGGVYVTGYYCIYYSTLHIDSDTSLVSFSSYASFLLVKFDTAGTYKWLVMPQPDTAGLYSLSNTYGVDMDVDGAGNSYILCQLAPGAYAGGSYVADSLGMYMLQYNNAGTFIAGNSMNIGFTMGAGQLLKIKKDYNYGRYYITGQIAGTGTLSFDGIPVEHMGFVGCFNNSGALLWQRQDTDPLAYYSSFGRAAIDAQHNIYLAGRESGADTFNTYAVLDGGSSVVPVIYKLDTNGTNIWAKNATVDATTFCSAVTVNGSEVDIAGQYPGLLKWAGYPDSLNLPESSGYHIFVTRFNSSTGAVLGMDSLASTTGDNNNATAMTSDKIGNFYVGGDFADQITVAGSTLSSAGGGSDFFVAKYGYANCSCTALPVASFTNSTGSPSVSFTYTGTTTSEDSVRWIFGDGGTSTTVSPTHTYTATGTYTACVTVYTSCGSDSVCQSVHIVVSGVSTLAFPDVSIYPNPVTEQLVIENATFGTTVVLFNIMGQQVYGGTVANSSQAIDMRTLPAGNYIIQLTDANGNRMNKTVVKE